MRPSTPLPPDASLERPRRACRCCPDTELALLYDRCRRVLAAVESPAELARIEERHAPEAE
jgi:hypothetical protein